MDGRFNTIAGWVLGAGIVFLGANLVTHEIFKGGHSEKMGFPVNGAEEHSGGGAAEQPIAFYLQTADAARGERQFSKCSGCHTINQGGAHGQGPNLWATMGRPVAGHAGFAYSDALRGKGGTWDWETMSAWLTSPRAFAPGTRMGFGGMSNPQDRADLLLYLNAQGGTLTVPPPPAAAPAGGNEAAGNASGGNEAAPAGNAANAAAPESNAAAAAGNASAPAAGH